MEGRKKKVNSWMFSNSKCKVYEGIRGLILYHNLRTVSKMPHPASVAGMEAAHQC